MKSGKKRPLSFPVGTLLVMTAVAAATRPAAAQEPSLGKPAVAPPIVITGDPAPAQQNPQKDPQSTFEPRSAPGEGQKLMEKLVGEWDVVKSLFLPGRDPGRTKGTCHQTMVNGGRFLHSQFAFDDGKGGTTPGVGLLGFDPKTGIFTSVWVDARSTAMSFRQSEGKFDGEQIILFGRSLDSKTPPRASRTVAHLEDNGRKLFHRQYNVGPDGKERLLMELAMTRKDTPPGKPTQTR